jgi:hypothetical protein
VGFAVLEASREALAVEAETFRGVVAMAEFDDVSAEFAHAVALGAIRS